MSPTSYQLLHPAIFCHTVNHRLTGNNYTIVEKLCKGCKKEKVAETCGIGDFFIKTSSQSLKKIGIPLLELVSFHMIGISEARIVEILLFHAHHEATRNFVVDGLNIDLAHLRLARFRILDLIEEERLRLVVLQSDERSRLTAHEKLHGLVTQRACIVDVVGDRRGTAKLVADFLVHDGDLDADLLDLGEHRLL